MADPVTRYPAYAELLAQAKVDQAYRRANPDPDRCLACFRNDYRTFLVRYSTMACHFPKIVRKRVDKGYAYEHVWRPHRVCNGCYPAI